MHYYLTSFLLQKFQYKLRFRLEFKISIPGCHQPRPAFGTSPQLSDHTSQQKYSEQIEPSAPISPRHQSPKRRFCSLSYGYRRLAFSKIKNVIFLKPKVGSTAYKTLISCLLSLVTPNWPQTTLLIRQSYSKTSMESNFTIFKLHFGYLEVIRSSSNEVTHRNTLYDHFTGFSNQK